MYIGWVFSFVNCIWNRTNFNYELFFAEKSNLVDYNLKISFRTIRTSYFQPRRKLNQVHENFFIQLNIFHFAFSFQCAYVYLVCRYILQVSEILSKQLYKPQKMQYIYIYIYTLIDSTYFDSCLIIAFLITLVILKALPINKLKILKFKDT